MVTQTDFDDLKNLVDGLLKEKEKDKEEIDKLKVKLWDISQDQATAPEVDERSTKLSELQNAAQEQQDLIKDIEDQMTNLALKKAKAEEDFCKVQDELTRFAGVDTHSGFDIRGNEERIGMTFGDSVTASSLKEFITHYRGVRLVNIRNRLMNWDDPEYRAQKLKLALRGPPAQYVSGESNRTKPWTLDDEKIIKQLEERYIYKDATELKILEAESITQNDREPLPEYMVRVQSAMEEAYMGEPDFVIGKKVAWKFLNGIKQKEIRSAVIREKWMKNKTEAKTSEELLHIAEVARMNISAAAATGMASHVDSRKKEEAGINQAKGYTKYPSRKERRDSRKYEYCQRIHPGG